ncbi:hypothetical protein [Phyllobacterium sp. 22552]|uniref:hypothetical protein n=1 Tax=Phyllobacterium sp. 22552 TaxID=3453941 RepID=UPI003F8677B1
MKNAQITWLEKEIDILHGRITAITGGARFSHCHHGPGSEVDTTDADLAKAQADLPMLQAMLARLKE